MLSRQQSALIASGCDVAFDTLTRYLYATDASIHEIVPSAVAFPQNAAQASAVISRAIDAGLSITPRGAGTGLVGGALGEGLIVEFARHNRSISELDLERRTVRVGAGVVLDQLNAFLKPHGFCFGPDVATSSRATLGGMIANNSSGSHVPVYGTTADHVRSLELVLADGRIEIVGPGHKGLPGEREIIEQFVHASASTIAKRMPADLLKRWPGYGLDRFLRERSNLCHVLAGSEGTLCAMVSAEVNIAPLPREKGVGLIFFGSVAEAMQATVELLDLKPAAIEHIDRVLLDQTKGQLAFKAARDLLDLDARPCESILIVEFFDEEVSTRLAAVLKKRLGLRTLILQTSQEANLIWSLRKAGLALLTGCKGPAKPVTGIEDTAVRPKQLPAYVAGLQSLLKPLGLQACFYGHAASGLLHVRPVLDVHSREDLRKFRQLMNEVSALVRQFNGSLAAEHGVGLVRTEFLREQLGDELLELMRQVKSTFDPGNHFNPGKLFDDARFKCDTLLRVGDGSELQLPFRPVLAFAAKDESFTGNLEQCNGCGGCRKETPTMCPTFVATGEEVMSTRGRANTIRAALASRFGGDDPLRSAELDQALSNCLSCKACTTECPSNVNMALLKAELLHARWERNGLPLRERVLSSVDLLGKLGCLAPDLANDALRWPWLRRLLSRTIGLAVERPLPAYAAERFDVWFAQRRANYSGTNSRRSPSCPPSRGQVILWDDTFVRYHEPHIGRAAVSVLEAARFEVVLPHGRKCCGRPAFSQGNLEQASRLGEYNLRLLSGAASEKASFGRRPNPLVAAGLSTAPILFLEPSCYSMFVEDYRELRLPGSESVAKRCFLFEQFVDDLLQRDPDALHFRKQIGPVAIHAHCHAKSLLNPAFMPRLAQRLPGRTATLLETGCCGMAGAFGALESKYKLSIRVAEPLMSTLQHQATGTVIVASGTSCRHQIEHLTPLRPKHMAELLAELLTSAGN
jgi:FAD/FMN-containing dehydrogenase/Fe-S oxidoreductase